MKRLILFCILNCNLLAGVNLISVGELVINLPAAHHFQEVITDEEASKNRQCFDEFISNKISKISFPESQKTVFEHITELGFFPEVRLGQRTSSKVTADRFSFAMRDLGENWCDKEKQKIVLKKFKREVTAKIKSVLGKRLISSLIDLNGTEDLAKCNCSDLSEFKYNESDGVAFFPNGTQVKNEELLSRLYIYFYAERKANRTRHIIPGTELLDILGGRKCLTRRYKRNEFGEKVLDYCTPKASRTSEVNDASSCVESIGTKYYDKCLSDRYENLKGESNASFCVEFIGTKYYDKCLSDRYENLKDEGNASSCVEFIGTKYYDKCLGNRYERIKDKNVEFSCDEFFGTKYYDKCLANRYENLEDINSESSCNEFIGTEYYENCLSVQQLQNHTETKSADDHAAAAAETQRKLDSVKSLEERLATESIDEEERENVYEQLHEQLQEINVRGLIYGSDGHIYDLNGAQVKNETLIERFFDEMTPSFEEIDSAEIIIMDTTTDEEDLELYE